MSNVCDASRSGLTCRGQMGSQIQNLCVSVSACFYAVAHAFDDSPHHSLSHGIYNLSPHVSVTSPPYQAMRVLLPVYVAPQH